MEWEDAFLTYLKKLEEKKPVVFCGDLNVAHQEIDLKNPKTNRKNAGFTDEERGCFQTLLDHGFVAVQMGRALLNEPAFVNRMKTEECARCNCHHSNYCIARMYTLDMACHQHLGKELPRCLKREIEKIENKG